jgi:hypothetical protein
MKPEPARRGQAGQRHGKQRRRGWLRNRRDEMHRQLAVLRPGRQGEGRRREEFQIAGQGEEIRVEGIAEITARGGIAEAVADQLRPADADQIVDREGLVAGDGRAGRLQAGDGLAVARPADADDLVEAQAVGGLRRRQGAAGGDAGAAVASIP